MGKEDPIYAEKKFLKKKNKKTEQTLNTITQEKFSEIK